MSAPQTLCADALRKIAKLSQIIDGDPVALSDALADIEREALKALDAAGESRV